jgi:hypothetical protein
VGPAGLAGLAGLADLADLAGLADPAGLAGPADAADLADLADGTDSASRLLARSCFSGCHPQKETLLKITNGWRSSGSGSGCCCALCAVRWVRIVAA